MSDREFEFEIVVVGAGPAGLAAASAAAECGRRVALVEGTPWLGGQIWRGQPPNFSSPQARRWFEKFRRSGAALLDRTSVIASPGRGRLLGEHPAGPREIRWEKLILAPGARELFLPFPGWTLPGVIGVGGLQTLVKNGWPVAGKKIVVAGTGPLLLAAADGLKRHGSEIISIAEQAPFSRVASFGLKLLAHPRKVFQGFGLRLRLAGVPYRFGVWPVQADGVDQVRSVTLTDGRKKWTEECDVLACGFNLTPNVELPLALGCELSGGFVGVNQWQETSAKGIYCAGEPTGIGGADCALTEGRIAGYAAGGEASKAAAWFNQRASWHRFRAALSETFRLRCELKSLAPDNVLLCRCEDVTLGRVKSFGGWREAKLQTRCGMGACQGRVCGAAANVIIGWGLESVRPPVLPARVQSLISTTDES
ncbi:MAG: FAD/NAD(P)-binding oxidoreductase [Verrucomicrobiota bacterium]|jgi:NADPH-dependent 2,4-dienoyl-CoA reductase/sulfur reductase-like enzyme